MSHALYNEMWRDTQQALRSLIDQDDKLTKKARDEDKRAALRWMLRFYAKYINITRRLDECYDQIVQPQKRIMIRKLLEGTIGRLLEIKNEIVVELEKSYCSYFDDLIIEEGLVHSDLEVISPRFYYREREVELSNRRLMIQHMIEKARKQADEDAIELEQLEEKLEEQLRRREEEKNDPNPQPKKAAAEPLVADPKVLQRQKFAVDHIRKLADAGPGFPKPGPAGPPIDPEFLELTGVSVTPIKVEPVPVREGVPEIQPVAHLTLEEAVHMIQIHERARQTRRAVFNQVQAIKKAKNSGGLSRKSGKKSRRPETAVVQISSEEALKHAVEAFKESRAARIIQGAWRAHSFKHSSRVRRLDEDIALGLVPRPNINYSYRDRVAEVQAIRRVRQKEMQQVYEDTILREREWVDRELGPQFFEDIGDEMREWMRVWWYTVLKMPEYPDEQEIVIPPQLLGLPKGIRPDMFPEVNPELPGIKPRTLGGSNLVTAGFWVAPKQYLLVLEELKKSKGQKEKKLTKEEKAELKKKKKEQEKIAKARRLQEKLKGFQLEPSKVMATLKVVERDYRKDWEFKRPYEDNPNEEIYEDIVRDDEAHDQQSAVRLAVDELMRAELELLLDAEWNEKQKKKKKKKPRKHKKKKKPPKKKKLPKDPTRGHTTEELLEELVKNGIVRNYQYRNMDEFMGEPGYGHYEARQQYKDPGPTLADVRQMIREMCILPLGSERVHELAPAAKSALIAGPPGVGKSLLVDILCTETGALLIDLSVEAVCGRYPGKKNLKMLMHLVNKVGRLLKPCIILFDNVHKDFYKKVPKPEKFLEPKRMSKQLKRLAKGIKPGDQMMIIGTTNAPWLSAGKGKKLIKMFERQIIVPSMDYGTRSFMWNKLIMEYNGVDRRFEVTPLAHVTNGITLDVMKQCISTVMTVPRRTQLISRPLDQQEIIDVFLEIPPVLTDKDRAAWEKFCSNLPIKKAREKLLEDWRKAAEKAAKEKKKKG